MSSRIEQELITAIVEQQNFRPIEALRINEDFFTDAQSREVFLFLRDRFRAKATFGQVPPPRYMHDVRPYFPWQWGQVQTSIEMLCVQLRECKIRYDCLRVADEITKAANSPRPTEAIGVLTHAATTITGQHSASDDLYMSQSVKLLDERYERLRDHKGIIGIPYPWDIVSNATLGLQNGHYIVIYGRPKNGKTWLATYIAAYAMAHHNARVLFYSMEMTALEILERMLAALAGVDYDLLHRGELDSADPDGWLRVQEWKAWLNGLVEYRTAFPDAWVPEICATSDNDEGGGGVNSLRAKIRDFHPNLVVVDAMYLMQDDREGKKGADWKVLTNVSRDLKKTAQRFDIPLIATAQGNRLADKDHRNADLREIAYADALGQDSDFIMRSDLKEDQTTKETRQIISFPGSRHSGRLRAIEMYFSPCTTFRGPTYGFKEIIASDNGTAAAPSGGAPSGGGGGKRAMPAILKSKPYTQQGRA